MSMREILFCGKRIDNGEWAEGSLLIDDHRNYYIGTYIPEYKPNTFVFSARGMGKTINRFIGVGLVMVDPETVGQYTGLTDTNGKKIFEGDIVKLQMPGYEMNGQIIFEEATFYIMEDDVCEVLWYEEAKFEVIGNIHDNPELLQGGSNE